MSPITKKEVTIRVAKAEDAPACGRICYEAFTAINTAHGFPADFPNPDAPAHMLSNMFSSEGIYSVVAESEGRIVGSNCLDERSVVSGIGPITIDPAEQNAGIGKMLMKAVLDRATARNSAGARLVQAAFHNRSFSLYTRLGFDVREPLACLQGRTTEREMPGCTVRPALPADLDDCNELSLRIHGFSRSGELTQAIARGLASVVTRGGRLTGYSTGLAFFAHTTAETNLDLQALIASVDSFGGAGILVPTRNSALLRWCLNNGLRVVQPLNLMSVGLYNEPGGAWLPSIMY